MRIIIFTADWSSKCTELQSRLLTINKTIPHQNVDVMTNTKQTIARSIKVLPTLIKVNDEGQEVARLLGLRGVEILTDFFN